MRLASPVQAVDEEVGKEDLELEAVVRQSETLHRSGSDGNLSAAGTASSGPARGGAAGGAFGGNVSSSSSHNYNIVGMVARPNRSALAVLDQPLLSYDVTLVSQTSDDRVWMISHLAKRWGGPISIAIFVTDEVLVRNERRWLNRIANQPGSYITEVHSKGASGYPVNFLRNTAIDRVSTTHFFLTDIDLWPSTFSYNAVLSQGEALLGNPHAALVLPAFEFSAPNRSRDELDAGREAIAKALPDTFEGLRDCAGGMEGPCRIFKSSTDTHLTTDYTSWWRATSPRRIPCFQSLRYEPYLVVPRLHSTPPFDERFWGYGKNKIQWIQHLRFAGFVFYVLPRAFVVHCPHPPSVSRAHWQQYRAKRDRLFRDFIHEQMRNATIRTTMCIAVEGEGAGATANWRPPIDTPATASNAVPTHL